MKPKNELFMDAIEWLIDNGLAENQGDIAVKAGLGPNLISRIKNGHVKAVSDDAIRALCDAFDASLVAECDTPNAGLLTYALRQIYFSLPNSSVTDFHHEIYPKTLTAAVPFGIYTQFSFHHIYPNGIYDTLCEFIIPLNITI